MWGKEGFMALKIDMSKGYDRMEWVFLAEAMKRMGFALKLIELIMKCITTVHYSIIIKGEPMGHIQPTIGIR